MKATPMSATQTFRELTFYNATAGALTTGRLGCRLRSIFAAGVPGSHRGASRAPGEKLF
jgi:hypothetical protein